MRHYILFLMLSIYILGCKQNNSNQTEVLNNLDTLSKKDLNQIVSEKQINGRWKCSAKEIGFNEICNLEFVGKKVIIRDFTGMVRNTNFERIDDRILFETGDVLQIKDEKTLIFPMPIPQFYTTINCICKPL